MKSLFYTAIALFLVGIVIGCGGGGGSSTTSATTATGTSATGTTATGSNDVFTTRLVSLNGGAISDPNNLQVGDATTFAVAKIDLTTGNFTALPNTGFSTTDTTGAAGSLNASSGQFLATKATGMSYTISATTGGVKYSATYAVTPVQPKLTGQVLDSNGVVVPFVGLTFVDGNGTQVGSAVSVLNGNFTASLPATAKRFNLVTSTIPAQTYFKLFTYGTGTYSPLISTCNAPLPALSAQTNTLPNQIAIAAVSGQGGIVNSPPPPPSCSP